VTLHSAIGENIRSGFCRNVHSRLSKNVERVKGIEPSSSAWKAVAMDSLKVTRHHNKSQITANSLAFP
jgi:hypothetical protein